MAQVDRQHYALQTIFSFFLGLMVVAVIGVGVNTFYPTPADRYQKQLQVLYDKQNAINSKGVEATGTSAIQLAQIQTQINAINEKQQASLSGWQINTSIVLVIFATIVMGISLVRADQLRVLSNGLLLGGLFTMVYGSGWVIASQASVARFFVVLFALVVAVALGYVKFVRLRPAAEAGRAPTAVEAADQAALEGRVSALEERLSAVVAALSGARSRDRDA